MHSAVRGYLATLVLIPCLASSAAFARTYAAPIQEDGGEIPGGGVWGTIGGAGTEASPYSISDFLSSPPADGELILLDGTYRGADSMILPSDGLGGNVVHPLYIHAQHDGEVVIDGATTYSPMSLLGDYWRIEGIDFRSQARPVTLGSVAASSRSSHLTMRRSVVYKDPIPCAADPCTLAADLPTYEAVTSENVHVLEVTQADDVLLEDVAAFGRGRKTIQVYESTDVTIRRAWVRTDGNWPWIASSNLKAITCEYASYDVRCENVLATVGGSPDTQLQPADYADVPQVFTTDGEAAAGSSWIPVGRDRYKTGLTIEGSIVYSLPGSKLTASHGLRVGGDGTYPNTGLKGVSIDNLAVWLPAASNGYRLVLTNCDDDPVIYPDGCSWSVGDGMSASPVTYDHVTLIGGRGSDTIRSDWPAAGSSNVHANADTGIDIFTPGNGGASMCYRTVDGTVTSEKLWPWPMEDRILAATQRSLWESADVMADLQSIFSSIPSECLKEGPTTSSVSGGGFK